jgi:hypothetical protein
MHYGLDHRAMARAQELFERLIAGGAPEVEAFIRDEVTEELFLDYKRSADNGGGNSLNNGDRSNLARAISGFANSAGGVIVWGVDCRNINGRGDVPSISFPIQFPTRFKSWLEQATSGLTIPPHSGVRHMALEIPNRPEGYVLSLIPEGAHAPYQTVGDMRYFMRAGSNFSAVPHAVLAGMFGRRPQPHIHYQYIIGLPRLVGQRAIESQLGLMITNFGIGIARDVFLNVRFRENAGLNSSISFVPTRSDDPWTGQFSFGSVLNLVSKPDARLAPEAQVLGVNLIFKIEPPFERAFSFESLCGASGSPSNRLEFSCDAGVAQEAYEQLIAAGRENRDAAGSQFNRAFYAALRT